MRSAARLLARLYPRAWRERYGAEFDALLEDTTLKPHDLFDLTTGALTMQIKSRNAAALFAAIAVAALIAGIAVAMSMSTRYVSTSVIHAIGDQQQFQPAIERVLSRTSLVAIIAKQNLYTAERRSQPLEDAIETMKRNIRIGRTYGDTSNAITVQFHYSEPDATRRTAQQLAAAIARETAHTAPVQEIVGASAARDTRSIAKITAAAVCGGAIAGLALLTIRRRQSRLA